MATITYTGADAPMISDKGAVKCDAVGFASTKDSEKFALLNYRDHNLLAVYVFDDKADAISFAKHILAVCGS